MASPFQIGARVRIVGGFEDGIEGVVIANEPTEESPYRYRVRTRHGVRHGGFPTSIGGLHPSRLIALEGKAVGS